jgi:hypothetical protein
MHNRLSVRLNVSLWAGPLALGIVLGASLGLMPQHGRGADSKSAAKTWTFESDEPGKTAKGFTSEVGTWEVVQDGQNRVLAQKARNENPVFNVTLIDGTNYKDIDLSVRLKALAGEHDQGGGLVWRARDKDNYYIARYNPLEDNLRVYKVEGGKRTQLDHADVPGNHEWHTLRITMTGREILGYVDGKRVLVAEDSTFPDAGKIGLWSKSDAQSYFDDLTVRE